ncbi:hypothetical protein BMAPRL20_2121 [Burkholderia mallei PRL-20]|nr:hypothetical protein BMAPRL20_2121 [Burkholderia mallei PRL-20]
MGAGGAPDARGRRGHARAPDACARTVGAAGATGMSGVCNRRDRSTYRRGA